jgi:hypothetical protein
VDTEDIMALDDSTIILILSAATAIAISACVALILLMRSRTRKLPAKSKSSKGPEIDSLLLPSSIEPPPFRVTKSVQSTDANQAKNELRILDLEREILADAIRHLYEAHAEGKITEEEREKLAGSYKSRMMTVKDAMAKDESKVALFELESMQEDLMKMFRERFGELTSKVEELRTRIDIKPLKEIKVQMPKPQTPIVPIQMEPEDETPGETEAKEKIKKVKKPPSEKPKTEAEQRIDEMRSKIDEVMSKLGQIEMES